MGGEDTYDQMLGTNSGHIKTKRNKDMAHDSLSAAFGRCCHQQIFCAQGAQRDTEAEADDMLDFLGAAVWKTAQHATGWPTPASHSKPFLSPPKKREKTDDNPGKETMHSVQNKHTLDVRVQCCAGSVSKGGGGHREKCKIG